LVTFTMTVAMFVPDSLNVPAGDLRERFTRPSRQLHG
jgi:hypothetical protein